jgi:nitroreductase
MDVFEAIKGRRSIRQFTDEPIEKETFEIDGG